MIFTKTDQSINIFHPGKAGWMYNLKIQKNEYITGKHWHDLSPVCTTVTPLIESAYNWIVVSDTAPG